MKFTLNEKKDIDALPIPDKRKKNYIAWDANRRAFGVRVTYTGQKVFVYRAKSAKGNSYSQYVLDDVSVYFKKYKRNAISVAFTDSETLRLEKSKKESYEAPSESLDYTFGELAEAYQYNLQIRKKSEKTIYDNDKRLNRSGCLLETFGHKAIETITTKELVEYHQRISKNGTFEANRQVMLFRQIYNFALTGGATNEPLVSKPNPIHKSFPFHKEDSNQTFLPVEEAKLLLDVIEGTNNPVTRSMLKFILLTGSRCGETSKAKWENIDFSTKKWFKPSSNTKQKQHVHLDIPDVAVSILENIKVTSRSEWVFCNPKTNYRLISPQKAWENIRDKLTELLKLKSLYPKAFEKHKDTLIKLNRKQFDSFLKEIQQDGTPMPANVSKQYRQVCGIDLSKYLGKTYNRLRIHDLRHTYASLLAHQGHRIEVVSKLLGHSNVSTTQMYTHLFDGALKEATNEVNNMFS